MTLGEQILTRRKKLGLSQMDLARKVGINHCHVSLIEANKRDPSLRVLNLLAAAVGAKVFILWENA